MSKTTIDLNKTSLLVLVVFLTLLLATACTMVVQPEDEPTVGLANPASVNCEEQGGTSTLETRGDGGEYRVCVFEDNLQCEEFAMLNGDCPVGGIKVTGYDTDASRYCAITGGTYTPAEGGNADGEDQGTCTLTDGTVCEAAAYYDGTCAP